MFSIYFKQAYCQSYHIHKKINWKKKKAENPNKKALPFNFSEVIYPDETGLPWYTFTLNVPGKHTSSFDVEVKKSEYQKIDTSMFVRGQKAEIPRNIRIKHSYTKARTENVLTISFLPFTRNSVNGTIRRLLHVDIVIRKNDKKHHKTRVKEGFVNNSLLADGKWYKFYVKEEGIYELSYKKIKELGFDNPDNVYVYGNKNSKLNEIVRENPPDDVIPISISRSAKDKSIRFYGDGASDWKFSDEKNMLLPVSHPYSKYNYYFLSNVPPPSGGTMQERAKINSPVDKTLDYFTYHTYHEKNDTNFLKSGKNWYGKHFDAETDFHIDFEPPNIRDNGNVKMYSVLVARSPSLSYYTFQTGNISEDLRIPSVSYNSTASFARPDTVLFDFTENFEEKIPVDIEYHKTKNSSEGWLDKVVLNVQSDLDVDDTPFFFTHPVSDTTRILRFNLSNVPENAKIWDVTYPLNIRTVPYNRKDGFVSFKTKASGKYMRFVVLDDATDFKTPDFSGEYTGFIENQNIHGSKVPDMVIVTNPAFREQAEDLKQFHGNRDDLHTLCVSTQQVYNEFSGGNPDAGAIRNMLQMFRERNPEKLKYVLLFGDGSYDNKSLTENNTNYIPTFQSQESLRPSRSFVTDDFYGLLDPGEGKASGLLDIGIGRLPVRNTEEARTMVQKIKSYPEKQAKGLWRNRLCFVGDDEDGNIFMSQADSLASVVEKTNDEFKIKKIYLDAYKQVISASEERYPGATRDLNDEIKNGVLLVNYVGHGAEDGLAHENLLDINEDIPTWNNADRLTILMTATCEFSRFDDFRRRYSAGEKALLKQEGGAVALFSTTRLVYAGANFRLNNKFIRNIFKKNEYGQKLRLGDIMRLTKNASGDNNNKRNFMLLGDPALKLAYAKNTVITDSINRRAVDTSNDTLRALEKVSVSGHIATPENSFIENFNGKIYPVVYDKKSKVKTLSNDGLKPFTFKKRNNILYKGKARVSDGRFSFEFYVPKDISYKVGTGKLFYFASDSLDSKTAMGAYDSVLIGGSSSEYEQNTDPPDIKLYLNSNEFDEGDVVNNHPVLIAFLSDEMGINTTGNGIGHNITLTIDGAPNKRYVLNDYYEASLGDFQEGKITYPLDGLSQGEHTLTLKAWDITNNSASSSISFKVKNEKQPVIQDLYAYPNPFSESTRFFFKHNQNQNGVKISLRIYNKYGQIVFNQQTNKHIDTNYDRSFKWNGKNNAGNDLPHGIYFYRIYVAPENGDNAVASGKIIYAQ